MQTLTTASVRASAALLTVLMLAASAGPALAAEIGEEAPQIDVTDWAQGELSLAENPDKKVRVLQFFSTVQPASVTAMDEMEEWHTEMSSKVDFVAVSNQGKTSIATFLEKHKLSYGVAVDGYDNTSAEYLGEKGKVLPYYVIVNAEGVLAWTGGSDDDPKDTIVEIVEGKFDVARHQKLEAARKKVSDMGPGTTMDDQEEALDELLELDPGDLRAYTQRFFIIQFRRDAEKWLAWAEKYVGWATAEEEAMALNNVAWELATRGDLSWRNPALALKAGKKAVEFAKDDEDAGIIDTYARALFNVGLIDKAITQQKKAIAAVTDESEESSKEDLEKTLKFYEAAMKAQKAEK